MYRLPRTLAPCLWAGQSIRQVFRETLRWAKAHRADWEHWHGRVCAFARAVRRCRSTGVGKVASGKSAIHELRRATLPTLRNASPRLAFMGVVAVCALGPLDPFAGLAARAAERPPVMGRNAGASAGHPLTTAAAFEILARGGNAFDAGVAALLVGGVVEQDLYSLGGEALVLVYPRSAGKVTAVVGQGWAPQGATIDWYTARNKTLDGKGLDPAVVPGALHAALTVLDRWGTMSFETVAARAIEYAEQGFPLRPRTVAAIARNAAYMQDWPSGLNQ
jgi:hypothetical protein